MERVAMVIGVIGVVFVLGCHRAVIVAEDSAPDVVPLEASSEDAASMDAPLETATASADSSPADAQPTSTRDPRCPATFSPGTSCATDVRCSYPQGECDCSSGSCSGVRQLGPHERGFVAPKTYWVCRRPFQVLIPRGTETAGCPGIVPKEGTPCTTSSTCTYSTRQPPGCCEQQAMCAAGTWHVIQCGSPA